MKRNAIYGSIYHIQLQQEAKMTPEQIFKPQKTYFKDKKGLIFDMDGTLIDSMKYWFQTAGDDTSAYPSYKEYMLEKYNNVIEPKPYATEILTLIKENGIPVCIASDTPITLSGGFLKRSGFENLIDFYISSEDVGILKKDSARIFVAAAEKMGLTPADCVVFEDRVEYVKLAKAAGFTVVGVYDEESRDDMFEIKHYADDYVYNLAKLYKSLF